MTDDESNVTYITFDGHVDLHKYRYLYFVIMFTAYILIIFSNSTIFCLICVHKNLQEPMYIFIASLLMNSVVFSTNIYPKLLIDFLSDRQITSYPACLLQFYLYYYCLAAEFLLLSVMAYDRYVSICKPLQYPTIMTNRTVIALLVFASLYPGIHMLGAVYLNGFLKICHFSAKGIFCNNAIQSLQCMRSKLTVIYGIFALITCTLLPSVFIIFTYTRIFIITYRSSREVRRKAAQTCLPHLLVLLSTSFLCYFDIIIVRVESDLSQVVRLIMTLQVFLYHPLFNPIVYGLKMKEISKHLKRWFCKRSKI